MTNDNDEFYLCQILNKTLVRIYLILDYINEKNISNLTITAVEIMDRFETRYKNTNKIIQKLSRANLIKKGEKNNGYDSYLITKKGKKFIDNFSEILEVFD